MSAISSLYSKDIVDLKIVQSDWLRVFWFISNELDISRYGICEWL